MSLWVPVVTGVFAWLCAIIFGVIADKSRRGSVPRNSVVGIRLPSTMQSDEAWVKAHRKTWTANALIAVIFFIGGGFMLLQSGEMSETPYLVAAAITFGSLVPILIIQVLVAQKAVR